MLLLLILSFWVSYYLKVRRIKSVHETIVALFAGGLIGLIVRLSPGTVVQSMISFSTSDISVLLPSLSNALIVNHRKHNPAQRTAPTDHSKFRLRAQTSQLLQELWCHSSFCFCRYLYICRSIGVSTYLFFQASCTSQVHRLTRSTQFTRMTLQCTRLHMGTFRLRRPVAWDHRVSYIRVDA